MVSSTLHFSLVPRPINTPLEIELTEEMEESWNKLEVDWEIRKVVQTSISLASSQTANSWMRSFHPALLEATWTITTQPNLLKDSFLLPPLLLRVLGKWKKVRERKWILTVWLNIDLCAKVTRLQITPRISSKLDSITWTGNENWDRISWICSTKRTASGRSWEQGNRVNYLPTTFLSSRKTYVSCQEPLDTCATK